MIEKTILVSKIDSFPLLCTNNERRMTTSDDVSVASHAEH